MPGSPAVKLGTVIGFATTGAEVAFSVMVVVALPAELVPVMVNVCVPEVVGAPVNTPFAKVIPAGRLAEDQLVAGLPPVCGKV